MVSRSHVFLVGVLSAMMAAPVGVAGQSRNTPIPHDVGQSVTPSFEGWFENPDGTFSLSFGYMNRNFQAPQHIPVGVDNAFEPGPADRGQPTRFLPRRQTGVFTVVVPGNFGRQTLTWTLTSGQETISIPGHLRPEWEIDALHEVTSGNRPPRLGFSPEGDTGQGPGGLRTSFTAEVGRPVELSVWVRDDGVQKRRSTRPPQLGLVWSLYRGPQDAAIASASPAVADSGQATTTITFDHPGDYVLRVLAWDDSGPQGPIMAGGFQCCWTNGFVDVSVRNPEGDPGP